MNDQISSGSVIGTAESARISIIVPCRNEVRHIARFLDTLNGQSGTPAASEILIIDGMSDDGTREILRVARDGNPSIRILDNPERTTPVALNLGIRAARGDIIIRMDVHADYAPDYVQQCVKVLEETGAENVGGPWRARGITYMHRAIAAAFQSKFSSGGALSHDIDYEGSADSVFLGCWRREIFDRMGMFDEELVRNQDEEHNYRIAQGGGRIWQSPRIKVTYFPRETLRATFEQYAQYGYWKVRVMQKHRKVLAVRHVVPGISLCSLVFLLSTAAFFVPARIGLTIVLSSYLSVSLVATLHAVVRTRSWAHLPILPVVFACFHLAYGVGLLRGILNFVLLRSTFRFSRGKAAGLQRELAVLDGVSLPNTDSSCDQVHRTARGSTTRSSKAVPMWKL